MLVVACIVGDDDDAAAPSTTVDASASAGSNSAGGSDTTISSTSDDPSASSSGDAGTDDSGDPPDGEDDDDGASSSTGEIDGPGPDAYDHNCAMCHGYYAEGTMLGPEIAHAHPLLAQWFVRHGDTNQFADKTTDPAEQQPYIGDTRVMTVFGNATVSAAELDEIVEWLGSLPRATEGGELFADLCSYCHGPAMPNDAFNPSDPDMRGLYYVKPAVAAADLSWTELTMHVRMGVNPDLSPDFRRRYMPPFDTTLLSDDELTTIAAWLCAQYPDDVAIPVGSYCNQLP